MGVVVTLILYALYIYFYGMATKLYSYLDCTQTYTDIPGTALATATSVSFAYGFWMYIGNWTSSTTNTYKNVIYRKGSSTSQDMTMHVYMDSTTPRLFVQFAYLVGDTPTTADSATNKSKNVVMVTNNFPMQKWVCMIVSMDSGQNCDIYVDGKMVQTFMLSSPLLSQPDSSYAVRAGAFGGYLAQVTNWPNAVDPNTAWNYYMAGNGQSILGNSYGLQVDVTQNNQIKSSLTIL
jgi:hypothetical protein